VTSGGTRCDCVASSSFLLLFSVVSLTPERRSRNLRQDLCSDDDFFSRGIQFYFIFLFEFVVDQMPFFSLLSVSLWLSYPKEMSLRNWVWKRISVNSESFAVRFGVRRSRVMDSEDVVSQQSNANRW
jgi:hypothetical protein